MRRLLATLMALGWAPPALASTIPDPTLGKRHVVVTAGLVDGSIDYGIDDRLQVGAGGYFTLVGMAAYGRVTYRVLDNTPAGAVAAPGSTEYGPFTSRSWGLGYSDYMGWPLVPNLELAWRLAPSHELTFGGNALVGWRGRF